MRQLLFLSREGIMQASQKFSLFSNVYLRYTQKNFEYIACFQKQK